MRLRLTGATRPDARLRLTRSPRARMLDLTVTPDMRRVNMAAIAEPTTQFRGFSPAAIQFLVDLRTNNDRAWFQPRKQEFETLLKEPLEAMIAALAERLEARGVPMLADPKRSP